MVDAEEPGAIPRGNEKRVPDVFKGELLQDHVARGALSVAKEKGGTEAVAPEDISVRLNNWQKVRGSFLHSAVYAAGMRGASITCLILGVVQAVRKK
jgi:hypothetical protein